MKKIISVVLVLMMMVTVVGCASNQKGTEDDITLDMPQSMAAIKEQIAKDGDQSLEDDGTLPGFMEIDLLSPENPLTDFPVAKEDMEAGIILQPMMNVLSDKIILIKAAEGKEDNVKAGLKKIQEQQIEEWKMYLPEQLEKAENAQIVQQGSYVLYVTYDDTKVLTDIFNGWFK